MSTFPDDHPIDWLRGRRRLTPAKIRRVLTRRISWLRGQLARPQPSPVRLEFFEDELRALVQVSELLGLDPIAAQEPAADA